MWFRDASRTRECGVGDAVPAVRVVDAPRARRYEIYVGDALAGFTIYRDRTGARVLVHSEVFPEFEHHGLGGELARGALDDIRDHGMRVVAQCPFVAAYLREHPEYADLVAG